MTMDLSDHTGGQSFEGRSVLVTGACGTVGAEIQRQLVSAGVSEVIGIDNNEEQVFFASERYSTVPQASVYLGELRDAKRLQDRMEGIDIVIHAAALKNVPVCEESPTDAVATNVLGTQNVIDCAIKVGAQRVLLTSTDKAVNPTTVMGTTKLMAERLMSAANIRRRGIEPIFSSTRFGNVLGSAGSVLPLFKRQIAAGGPVTLTDPDMTRFVMTCEDAVRLVLRSIFIARGGEVFITKMPVARIEDLAAVMIEELAPVYGFAPSSIETVTVGARPGEKLYEELMNAEEVRRSFDIGDFLVVQPALASRYGFVDYSFDGAQSVDRPYVSTEEQGMSKPELKQYLRDNGLLNNDSRSSDE